MEKKDLYKYIFIVAAIWNCLGSSVLILVVMINNANLLLLFGIATRPDLFLFWIAFGGIFVLGLGYYRVSTDIDKKQNQYIVIIGTIIKLLFLIVAIVFYFLGDVTIVFVTFGCINLIFASLFIEFLLSQRK